MTVEKLIIIGSGPAAWTAATYAARADLSPLVFEGALNEENRVSQVLPYGQLNWAQLVQDFPGFPQGAFGPELIVKFKEQALRFGTRVITEDVVGLDLSARPFLMNDSTGQRYVSHSIIIVTGGKRRDWKFGFENNGVSFCPSDDAMLPRARNHPVAVVGGGDAALNGAMSASLYASHVYLVHRGSSFPAKRYYIDYVRANPDITILIDRTIAGIHGTVENGVTGLSLKNLRTGGEETLDVSMVFHCLGSTPNTYLFAGQLQLNDRGYIKLINPPTSATSVEGVFAAGEAADPIDKQAITAAGMGCKAALDAERWLAAMGIH